MIDGELAQLACVTEVCAPKAGNVHPGAPFDDASWIEFATSAMVVRPILDLAAQRGVGPTVLDAVKATRNAVGNNTNLGILLLLAPLCAAPADRDPADGVAGVLSALTMRDAEAVYEAIRTANPGGLGVSAHEDVADRPTMGLVDAMRLASDRDAIARQYVTGFHDVIRLIAPGIVELYRQGAGLDDVLVRTHIEQMARQPDSLIGRKCGEGTARESQRRAAAVLEAGGPETDRGRELFDRLDDWLRADGHRRNPGTSADLIAAGLFVALRRGEIEQPFLWSGSTEVAGGFEATS